MSSNSPAVLPSEETPWDDQRWLEGSDGTWQRRLRWLQSWWRAERLHSPPGPMRHGERLVASMLPLGVGLRPNLLTSEAAEAAERAIHQFKSSAAPGIIQEDRLKRNLLSSQPLCFNLFGHLSAHPESVLSWVRGFSPTAERVTDVRLEWAPAEGTIGRSAFDAFVEYELPGGARGFLGIECKYAENLRASLTKPADDKWRGPTRTDAWTHDAIERLDRTGLRQFWFNQLLTQLVRSEAGYAEGFGLVVALQEDGAAEEAVQSVQSCLSDPSELAFVSIESVVDAVEGQDAWKASFRERYLDFAPVQHLL